MLVYTGFKLNLKTEETKQMYLRWIGSALVVTALTSVAFGQAANNADGKSVTGPAVTERLARHRHGPVQNRQAREDGTSTSTNWSGYALTGTTFTTVKGYWVVPVANCSVTPGTRSNPTYSSFWVGIDGYSSSTVEQTGTDSDCDGTTPTYYAWYEFYPADSYEILTVPVAPGNTISAQVVYSGSEFTVTITNETTGKSFSKSSTVRNAKRSSAEWIAEAPCCTRGGGILPLADFGTVSFGSTNYPNTANSTAIDSFANADIQQINMVSSSNVPEDNTSGPLPTVGDGGFTVVWASE